MHCTVLEGHSPCSSHLPFAVLGSPLELDVPVLGVHLCTVGDGHGHRAEEIQARRSVCYLWAQEDFTAVQCLDTKNTQRVNANLIR